MSVGSLSAHAGSKTAGFPHNLLSLLFAFVLVVSLVPRVAWAVSAEDDGAFAAQATTPEVEAAAVEAAALADQMSLTCEVIGMDSRGNTQVWARSSTYTMPEGATAAALSEHMFAATGLKADYNPNAAYGWELKTITSPFESGAVLGFDATTGNYWQLFVNGKASDYGAGSVILHSGDRVVWAYSAYGSSLPSPDDLVIDPSAPRPNYHATWPGFANGMAGSVVNAPTPTELAELFWSYNFRERSGDLSASDPLLVNGRLYLVVNGELRGINTTTGAVEQRANVGSSSAYFNRPVYADGVIIVPSDNGSLAAFTADKLTCVWKTKPLEVVDGENFQSLSALTVVGSSVYAGFTVAGQGESTNRGVLVCVAIHDGSVVWTKDERAQGDTSMGYYWAGAAASGEDLVLGDDAGRVRLLDGLTGAVLSSVDVGASVRTGIIAVPDAARTSIETFVAVGRDGSMHKIVREGDVLKKAGFVSFAPRSTSTPTVVNGTAFVGAVDADGYGTLSVIDLATMSVARTVRGGLGEAQGAPLVSVQGGETYVYFTCNGRPGGMYSYRVGDELAHLLYTPPTDQQQYSISSIIADSEGTLYYLNDSGNLFALKGAQSVGHAGNQAQPPAANTASGDGGAAPVPLAHNAEQAKEAAKSEGEGESEGKGEKASTTKTDGGKATTRASEYAADTKASLEESGGVNPWAVGGIALGAVGLACAAGSVVRARYKQGGVR